MDSISGIRAFIGVVEEGSFTAAAEQMAMSVSLVSKYIAQLETRLGVRLLNRTTRSLTLTEIGEIYYEKSQQVLEGFDELEKVIKDKRASPCGNLVISAPQTFGEMFLSPLIEEFLKKYPDITVDLQLSDRLVNLVDETIDVSIRIAELPDSNMIARYLDSARIVCCVSPEYLKQHPVPAHPSDLLSHECILDKNFKEANKWPFLVNGERTTIKVNGRLAVNSARTTRDMVLAGRGVALIPLYAIDNDIKEGRIKIILEQYEAFDLGVYIIYLDRHHLAAKIRAFVDFVSMKFDKKLI